MDRTQKSPFGASAGSALARPETFREVAAVGEAVLFGIRHEWVLPTLLEAGRARERWPGKTLIDCNNPVKVERFTLVTEPGDSLAEAIERTAVGAHVVKAFRLCKRDAT